MKNWVLVFGVLASVSVSAGERISFQISSESCTQRVYGNTDWSSTEHCLENLQRLCNDDLQHSPEIDKAMVRITDYAKTDSTFDLSRVSKDGRMTYQSREIYNTERLCFDDQSNVPHGRHCHDVKQYYGTEFRSTCTAWIDLPETHSVTFNKTPTIRKVTSTTSNACVAVENDLLANSSLVQSIIRSTQSGPLSPPSQCWVEYYLISRRQ